MNRTFARTFTSVALLGFGAAACGEGGPPQESVTVTDGTATVMVDDDFFAAADLTVPTGHTVTWEWAEGARNHNVVGDGFAIDTQSEGTFTHRFDEPGTYDYACTLHGGMRGTVTVR